MALNRSFLKFFEEMSARIRNIDVNDIETEIKECGRYLREMHAALSKTKSVGGRQQLAACIANVQGYRTKLKIMRNIGSNSNKKQLPSHRVKWKDTRSAFKNRIRTGVIVNLTHKDPSEFLVDAFKLFRNRIVNALKKEASLKVNMVFCGEFVVKKGDMEVFEYKYMNTKNSPIYNNTDIAEWFDQRVIRPVLAELEEFQERDSGWALSSIVNLVVNINKFTQQLGSSYIELPQTIKKKEACINVKNNDEACFAWAVTSALHPCGSHSDRINSYPHFSKVLNLKNITMPMTIIQIPRFESQNDVSINVYILEKVRKNFIVNPTYLTKNKKAKHVNLLLIQDTYEEEDGSPLKYHYVWIKNLSRLVSKQLSKHDGRKYFCERCLHYFHSELKLSKHEEDCMNLNSCRVRLPQPGETMYFKNYKNNEKVPFVIYADLECLLVSPDFKQASEEKNAKTLQHHVPYSVGYYVKCSYDNSLSFYRSYHGEDCRQWFANEMKQFAEDVETVFLCPLPMEPLTPIQEYEFRTIHNCHICKKPFGEGATRVHDHCHLTGMYRGPAHEECNINYQDSHVIPIVFHNLSGYDSHFIIKNIANDFEGRVDLLPVNKERYISFTKHVEDNLVQFRFIDSYRFLASSLELLASYLPDYPILRSQFKNLDESAYKLLTRKGVLPYDHIDSWSTLNESALPSKSLFYSKLTDSHISDDDYIHAQIVYNTFGCQNLGEYSDLYMKTDILLLADIFEQFRVSCLGTYGLDPAHYYTLPGYTWDCMMKFTQINLELLSDIDMIMFIERGIRGGLSQCSKRHAKANNKYLPDFNPLEPSKYLFYCDINNQYGWAMSQYLPYGKFEWVQDVENINFNVPENNSEGYILEVDLEYPDSFHDSHSDLPFCPEHSKPPKCKETKLLASLHNKYRYVIHYRNLIQALENGLELKKIHRVLKFKQSDWLKSYIDLNTKLRTTANNDFEKDLFKLMNNAVFGKTMENIRKHSNVKLVSKWEGRYGAEALISKPQFKSSTIFEENLVAIELNKTEIYFNKPIYVGMCILDIAKLKIYEFHYQYMKSRFDNKARVCYTDTDSLIYEIECNDLYEVIKNDAHDHFDTSDYPDNNIYNIPRVNKKVLGMMKDENSGKIMTEFVGHRSKSYATRVEGRIEIKKCKGVKKHIIKNRLTFDDYLQCLKESTEMDVQQILFQCRSHNVATVEQTKVALNPYDDKRYICSDGVNTLPWGHYAIMDLV